MAYKIEPWKDCIHWLVKCEILTPGLPCYTLEVLIQALRDGVLLCMLLDTLEPNCLDFGNVHQKPQMTRCLCLQNIKLFLSTCQDVFGLDESDLFEPSMLFDFYDIYQVIYTLSKLSTSTKALKRASGFFFKKNYMLTKTDFSKTLSTNDGNFSQEHRERLSYNDYCSNVRNEETYQKLCAFNTPRSPQGLLTSPQLSGKRKYVADELLESEIKYVMVLKIIQQCFMEPLKKRMNSVDVQGIFGEIEELYNIHQNFLNDLNEAVEPHNSKQLSEVFLNKYEKFLIYGDYCTNITIALALLKQKCNENPSLKKDIMKCQDGLKEGRYVLEDLLCMPFQRFFKYPLLLERLIGDTQPSHEDYRGLEEAYDAMKDICAYINELKRGKEKLEALQKIEESITDLKMPPNTTLKNYGCCLKDDELRVSCQGERRNSRYVFLFDHVMIICKQLKDNKYSFQDSLDLSQYTVQPCSSNTRRASSYRWYLIPENKNDVKEYAFSTKQEQQKEEWIKAIKEALDNIKPSCLSHTDHQLLMKSFQEKSICNYCKRSLKGLVFQGFWCKRCKITLHKECIVSSGRCNTQVKRPQPPVPESKKEVPPPPYCEVMQWKDYTDLRKYKWFVGEIEREEATNLLRQRRNGTFLVRVRPKGKNCSNESSFALGLKTNTGVKHMIVFERLMNGLLKYHLSNARFFIDIAELVMFYEHTSLLENFDRLDLKLLLPYHQDSPAEYAMDISQEETTEWTGSNSDDDYVDYNKEEDETITEQADFSPIETFLVNDYDHSIYSRQTDNPQRDFTNKEFDINYPNNQDSFPEISGFIYESSFERERGPIDCQKLSNNENYHEPPEVKITGSKEIPTYEKDRRLLGLSQSFPKSSVEEYRLNEKRELINKYNAKLVRASFGKTSTSNFSTVSIADEAERVSSVGTFQPKQEFHVKKSEIESSIKAMSISVRENPDSVSPVLSRKISPREEIYEERGLRKKQDEVEQEARIFGQYINSNDETFYESKSIHNDSKNFETRDSHLCCTPKWKQSSRSNTVGTQTYSFDFPSEQDNIDILGQFLVSELKTIQNKTILHEVKKAIQNAIMHGIDKDNAK